MKPRNHEWRQRAGAGGGALLGATGASARDKGTEFFASYPSYDASFDSQWLVTPLWNAWSQICASPPDQPWILGSVYYEGEEITASDTKKLLQVVDEVLDSLQFCCRCGGEISLIYGVERHLPVTENHRRTLQQNVCGGSEEIALS